MKPGYKSTEFWLSAPAAMCGVLAASGIFPIDSALGEALGLVMTTLAALGYTGSRMAIKKKQAEEEAKWESVEEEEKE